MYEYYGGSRRLAEALKNHITDEQKLTRLAELLNYRPEQLKEDIKALDDYVADHQRKERETDSLEFVKSFWDLLDDETDEIDEIENEVKEINKDNYLEIAKIISNNDEKVMERVSECVTDPLKYCEKYSETFVKYIEKYNEDNDCMDRDHDIYDMIPDDIIWIGILYILIENGYIIEETGDECLNTFIDDVNSFKVMQDAGIEVSEDLDCLKEDKYGYTCTWAGALDEEPVMQGYVIGAYLVGTDGYNIFVCTKEKLDALSKLAEDVDGMICHCSTC